MQIYHDADRAPVFPGNGAYQLSAADVILGRAVGKIHSYHVNTGSDHLLEYLPVVGSGAESGDDFGPALQGGSVSDGGGAGLSGCIHGYFSSSSIDTRSYG